MEHDEATLVSTFGLSACSWVSGRKIHRYMNEGSRLSIPMGNALLDLHAKCGCLDMARGFFYSMPARNVISWTTMVSGYLRQGNCLIVARKGKLSCGRLCLMSMCSIIASKQLWPSLKRCR